MEGAEDKRVFPYLVEANGIRWCDESKTPIVDIKEYGGVNNLLTRETISTELKARGIENLGIIVDANDSLEGRWSSIRGFCLEDFPDFPDRPMAEGCVLTSKDGIRFGVWIMPDNQTSGMLETFLGYLVSDEADRKGSLWSYSGEVLEEARRKGAPFSEAHTDKARIHCWLSWQDPPGSQLHTAVMRRVLDPTAESAEPFIAWFRRLYEISPSGAARASRGSPSDRNRPATRVDGLHGRS